MQKRQEGAVQILEKKKEKETASALGRKRERGIYPGGRRSLRMGRGSLKKRKKICSKEERAWIARFRRRGKKR